MTIEKYSIFDPKVDMPLHELPRKEARAAYDWFLSQRESRIQVLTQYSLESGICLKKNGIEKLHNLLVAEVHKEGLREVPTARVYSLCNDIAIFISEMLIRNSASLKWKFYVAHERDVSYHRPVIVGFKVKSKRVDIDFILCQYAHRLSQGGEKEEGFLRRIYDSALEQTKEKGEQE